MFCGILFHRLQIQRVIKVHKKILSAIIAVSIAACPLSAFASVLGGSLIDGYDMEIGEGTHFYHNMFYSDQSGVGQQTENYITYSPNDLVAPIITNGAHLFGTTAISKEISRLENDGYDILGSTNADFFSLQTGVPMSNAIANGEILTKDNSGQDGIGVLSDGTAFISYFSISSVLSREDGSEINIHNINKYRQPYSIYLMTSKFSSETHNTTEGIDVILGDVEGEMRLGSQITAKVEAVNEESTSVPIPEDKIIITIDKNAPSEYYDAIASLAVDEEITISFTAEGDERWNDVVFGMGSVGGRLLSGGEINPNLEQGAAPRTAIGTKNDGSIVLYTIDGRQSGYSYGVQLKTLAARMKELGCTDAINLDGGGSTSISIQFPGDEQASLVNKPSDKKERGVSTFFSFLNNAKATGEIEHIHLYPKSNYVLTGASVQLSASATDSGFHPVPLSDISYYVEKGKESTISRSGLFTAKDSGSVTVYAESEGAEDSIQIVCLNTPTSIKIFNSSTNKELSELVLDANESITFSAEAYGGFNKLITKADSFTWSADDIIGSFNGSTFTASENYGSSGNIYVTAGKTTVSMPVTLKSASSSDPKAYPEIEMNYIDGKVFGSINSEYNIPINEESIWVKVDGNKVDFEYDPTMCEFELEVMENARKITVFAANTMDFASLETFYLGELSEVENPFCDTDAHWAENILSYMFENKIINGELIDGILHFNPQKHMTRSEFAVMICNYLKINTEDYADVSLPYTDIDTIPAWAMNSFKALYSLGVVTGRYVSDTESCADPLASINRAEAATIVARTLPGNLFKADFTAPDKSDIPSWALDGITTLVNLKAMNGYEDGSFLPMQKLTKAEAAKILYCVI